MEFGCGVVKRSMTVLAMSKWPAECDKSTSIVNGRYCLCVRPWLEVLVMHAVLLFRDILEGTGEVARIALVLLADPRLSWADAEAASSPSDGSCLHPRPSVCGPRWSREVSRAVVLTPLFLHVANIPRISRQLSRSPTRRFGVHHVLLPSLQRG